MTSRQAAVHEAIGELQRLSELFQERRRQLAREAGLSEAQWRVLEEVAEEDFMPSMFARERACTPAAVSRTLRSLLDAELVRVRVSAGDGRQRVYRLTPKGRRVLDRLHESRKRAIEAVWSRFGRRELEAFSGFAATLSDGLERYIRGADDARRTPR